MKKEILYNLNSILIATILLVVILIVYEICFRIGRYYQRKTHNEIKNQTTAIQASTLGLLALLLGFTFNMALLRYDNRSGAVVKEANAIGTAMLRTQLLPKPYDSIMLSLLKQYVDLRVELSSVDWTNVDERSVFDKKTDELQKKAWRTGMIAAKIDPTEVTTGYFIASLNNVIDARGERNALLQNHVPEVVLFLLFLVFVINGALMGYSSGLSLKRAYIPTIMLTLLIVMVVFIIIDLDRPKRGFIKVRQDSLIELKKNF